MDLSQSSLAVLRRQLLGFADEINPETDPELRALLAALSGDLRAGARQLASAEIRRRKALQREWMRLEALFSGREELRDRGFQAIAGVDEVGVGPLAGPVVAAAVILPDEVELPRLNDSKKLSPEARRTLDAAIREQAISFAIGEVDPEEIDRINVYQAGLEAMRRAVVGLEVTADYVCVDARKIPRLDMPQEAIPKGDSKDASIAAASIVAKVYRDQIMQELDAQYPGYGFAQHMGYPTSEHCEALERLGASPVHRKSYGPVAKVL